MNGNPKLIESGRNVLINEDKSNRLLKKQTAQGSPVIYLALAAGATALALGLALSKKNRKWASFVGQWVPTILMIGLYNRLDSEKHFNKDNKNIYLH